MTKYSVVAMPTLVLKLAGLLRKGSYYLKVAAAMIAIAYLMTACNRLALGTVMRWLGLL